MLQRSVQRSLRQTASRLYRPSCSLCTCSCGQRFRPNGQPPETKRHYPGYKGRTSPRTDHARRREKSHALTQEGKERYRELKERDSTLHYEVFTQWKKLGCIEVDADTAVNFLNDFDELARTHTLRVGAGIDVQAFQQVRQDHAVSEKDCQRICLVLLNTRHDEHSRHLGKLLLFSLSASGSELATLKIMSHALLLTKIRPQALKSSEIAPVRKRLRELAKQGRKHRAMVLEGKVAYELGERDYAMKLWDEAMEPAVQAYKAERERKTRRGKSSAVDDEFDRDLLNLDSPWIELTIAARAKKDYDKVKRAIAIGCEQDDPTSHYNAALESKRYSGDVHIGTSTWLYHTIKAAGALHAKAAHELGVFYGESLWKYIEDEPPDHIKPTPFDSYPPDSTFNAVKSLFDRAGIALGFFSPPPQNEVDGLFHTAVYPATAKQRIDMALLWLQIGIHYGYAPSYLAYAKLLRDKKVYPDANVPRPALALSDKRYTFASRADMEAGVPIEREDPNPQPKPTPIVEEEEEERPPHYSPEGAKNKIREVFYAAIAMNIRRGHVTKLRAGRGNKDEDSFSTEDEVMSDNIPNHVSKWFRNPEVREMYMDEKNWVMYDDALDVDIAEMAQAICEEEEWDIYDHDGSLMYRHGLKRKRS